MFQVRGELQRR
ncbi:unnamed protein product [Linum tenue]|uniref:Uncharacterized protein n=1 Tax=Linum tenue TaxID=586396 RepID=A0AAV0L238_9ROSI|nr:unnamed protein product [Linum tenue]